MVLAGNNTLYYKVHCTLDTELHMNVGECIQGVLLVAGATRNKQCAQ